ncbi:hypothetical protein V8B97DRAFT_1384040 [Scleroderma yunnanense]
MDCGEPACTELPIIIEPWTDPAEERYNIILPATVFQIHHAMEDTTDKKGFTIDGKKFGQVLVIANVVSVEPRGPTMYRFEVDDGTGQIPAWKTLTSVRAAQSSEQEQAERESYLALVGSFIEVTAKVKKIGNGLSLDFETQPRKIRDFHQVLFHNLNAMFIHVRPNDVSPPSIIQHAEPTDVPLADAASLGPMQGEAVQTGASQRPNQGKGRMKCDQYYTTGLDSLSRCIIQTVRQLGKYTTTGLVTRSEIQQELLPQYGATEEEFENTVTYLVVEGYLTSPLEDEYVMITPRVK